MAKTRIKFGRTPGDIGKIAIIAMLEKGHTRSITTAAAKAFKKMIRMKERAVLKERSLREIEENINERE